MKSKQEKEFDCVEMKRNAQKRIYEEIRGLSREQELKYFSDRTDQGPFRGWLKRVEECRKSAQAS